MRKLMLTCLAATLYISGHAQTLFTYGDHSVSKEEFLKVYKKNSLNKTPDMSDTALRSYLDLYALFRMKVAEADREKLDTLTSIDHELDTYRKQLAKNYLTDDQITNKLIEEAYDRMKEEVHVEHILVSCPSGSDTTAPYAKIDSIYHLIESGKQSFEAMTKLSDDKGSRDHNGDIGYFTSLQTVYPFENAAYTTPVGGISKPFRTQFGYHIVKVLDKHKNLGQVKVAQILIRVSKSNGPEADAIAHKRADSVETALRNGASFYELVKQYSDDKYTVNDSGIMKPFGAGRMVPAFEEASFALKSPGDVSAPVKTDYGYHIIKLLARYPLQPYDSLYPTIKHKVENDSRAQVARERFFDKVKEKNGFKEYPENLKEITEKIMAIPDTGRGGRVFHASAFKHMNKTLFELAGKKYTQSDFVTYMETLMHSRLNGARAAVVHDAYNNYVNNVVNDVEEHRLVQENPDFKSLMEEYRDGIMLFELMDRNVWSKAAHDSEGLKAFYEKNKNKYMWEPGFEGAVYKFKNKTELDSGLALIKAGKSEEDIAKALNHSNNPDAVTVQKGRYEFSHFKDASESELERSNIKVIPTPNAATYTVVYAKQIYKTASPKSLEDARGYVVAEYQDHLEKQWNDKMKREYPLKVNESVFKSMVKK